MVRLGSVAACRPSTFPKKRPARYRSHRTVTAAAVLVCLTARPELRSRGSGLVAVRGGVHLRSLHFVLCFFFFSRRYRPLVFDLFCFVVFFFVFQQPRWTCGRGRPAAAPVRGTPNARRARAAPRAAASAASACRRAADSAACSTSATPVSGRFISFCFFFCVLFSIETVFRDRSAGWSRPDPFCSVIGSRRPMKTLRRRCRCGCETASTPRPFRGLISARNECHPL